MTPKVIRYALGTMAFLEEKDFSEHRTEIFLSPNPCSAPARPASFSGFSHGAHDGTYGYLASVPWLSLWQTEHFRRVVAMRAESSKCYVLPVLSVQDHVSQGCLRELS